MITIKEEFLTHDKLARAIKLGGYEVLALWLALKGYVAKHLTDGFIPDEDLDTLPGAPPKARKAMEALVGCGRVDRDGTRGAGLVDPASNGWQLHDYLDHGTPSEREEERRRLARERKARQRDKQRDIDDPESRTVTRDIPRDVTRDTRVDKLRDVPRDRVRDLARADASQPNPDQIQPGVSSQRPDTLGLDESETLRGLDRPELQAASQLFGEWGPAQVGKIGRWRGFTPEQTRRLEAANVVPKDLEKRFHQHHLSRGTYSQCWQAEAENWVDAEERKARLQSRSSAPEPDSETRLQTAKTVFVMGAD